MGDVTMTVPVIDSLARQHPEITFTVVSQDNFAAFFDYMPENVRFFSASLKKDHKGIKGIYKLFQQLNKLGITHVADLHNVLRSKLLRFFFFISGVRTFHIKKGKKEKRNLTRKTDKNLFPLKSSFIRYQEVFLLLGLHFNLNFHSIFGKKKGDLNKIKYFTGDKNEEWIGIAPFAKHVGKIYPLEKTEEIVRELSTNSSIKIFLFGAGEKENHILSCWEEKYRNTISVNGKLKGLREELILISQLNVMYSMDSANMHLASLTNTPVISIWGATHPYSGFLGWKQSLEDAIGSDLSCRPCSVYGNKSCYRKDYACLNNLSVEKILEALNKYL
ncbi:MAG: glycosyltransferase family 9 protein [Candidatus Azobacteroides sp.]|nr:glycosyltransferase family 9 protein [Candidatus Azobacteroides sp.]